MRKLFSFLFFCLSGLFVSAQGKGIDADIRNMSKETDPVKALYMMSQIIQHYKLDSAKDGETLDLLNGTVAVTFAMNKNHEEFEKYLHRIKNKFNETSFLNMTAAKLLDKNIDDDYALKLAKETIDIYQSYKDDPNAKPAGYSNEDWKRFMDFAQYPYYDTYAEALFAEKKYSEALKYQKMAFNGNPENGIPTAVERYAKLLELNGDKQAAKQLLTKVAGLGKLNKTMIDQLKSIYVSEHGNNEKFNLYLDSLQVGAKSDLVKELKGKMLDVNAPGFSLRDIKGHRVRLADYKGKVVILDLWATWCKPCIASFPAMQMLAKKFPDVAFLFIDVNEPGKDALTRVKKFMVKNKYDFVVLMDEPVKPNSDKYKITSTYKPDGIPAKYIIDKSGKLRFTTSGFDTDSQLINELEAMIGIVKGL